MNDIRLSVFPLFAKNPRFLDFAAFIEIVAQNAVTCQVILSAGKMVQFSDKSCKDSSLYLSVATEKHGQLETSALTKD